MSGSAPAIHLSRLHFPVTTLGPGDRIGVWFQGCAIRCPGCISVDTWEFSRASRVELASAVAVLEQWIGRAEGITITGGEPFDQPGALKALLEWLAEEAGRLDVLVYSGYDFETLSARHGAMLEKIDAIVSGPFVAGAGGDRELRGSDNQELRLMTDRAKDRFNTSPQARRTLDVAEEGDAIHFAGIPQAGDWERLEAGLDQKGISGLFSHRGR